MLRKIGTRVPLVGFSLVDIYRHIRAAEVIKTPCMAHYHCFDIGHFVNRLLDLSLELVIRLVVHLGEDVIQWSPQEGYHRITYFWS